MKESRKFVMAKALLDFAKIAFGGGVLAKVFNLNIPDWLIITLSGIFVLLLMAFAFYLMKDDKDNDNNKKK